MVRLAVVLVALAGVAEVRAESPRPTTIDAGFPVLGVTFSPDGSQLACGGATLGRVAPNILTIQPSVVVFDATTLKPIFDQRQGNKNGYTSAGGHYNLAFSPDGKSLAWGGINTSHLAYLWGKNQAQPTGLEQTRGTRANTSGIAFAPDGKSLYWARWNGEITVWDVAAGKEVRTFPSGLREASALVVSPDGRLLACADRSERIALIDARTGNVVHKLTARGKGYPSLAFSPDGAVLAVAGGGVATLWETASGKELKELGTKVSAVAFSPNGRALALGGTAGIELWDVAAGKRLSELPTNRSVQTLAFAPDGKRLASAGATGGNSEVVLWDVASVVVRKGPPRPVTDEELNRLWADLLGEPAKAFRAVWTLAESPDQAVAFLGKQVKPAAPSPVDAKTVERLISDLDAGQFAAREKASAELAKQGRVVLPAIVRALEGKPSPEARRRLEELRDKLQEAAPPPNELRNLRAVRVLEDVGTAEAKRVLRTLAGGDADSPLTREAKAALGRLEK